MIRNRRATRCRLPAANDPIAGKWEGTISSPQGDTDITINLKRKGEEIVGDYETERGGGEIVEGKFNAESKTLTLAAENERFNLEFDGQVSGDTYAGEIDFNGGMFSVDFEAKKVGGAGRYRELIRCCRS